MRLTASEHDEQVALIQWATLQERAIPELRMLYANGNGGLRHPVVGHRMKQEGVKAGVLDLTLPVARTAFGSSHHGLYLEMKVRGRKLTKDQQWWAQALTEQGYCVKVCYNWESAKNVILTYLGRKA